MVQNQTVFCPCRDGNVYALNLVDGKPIWHQSISGKAPILAGLAISKDGNTLFAAVSFVLFAGSAWSRVQLHPQGEWGLLPGFAQL